MTPTLKPASVTKRRGHLYVGRYSLRTIFGTSHYYFVPAIRESNSVSEYVLRMGFKSCMTFFCTKENVYYVDGNRNVWETDIVDIGDVVFSPVCTEKSRVVNFRKLHKLEWLFG